ncbi:MAG: GNAT family N-acetyltransferase [Candidatus Nitronauta litoralis]|uniref:GNAT family N-acetyltransferase n=1 Tax=Candidatus Nitronauta litoralis TaxID=2705533 RepID=A0A7T0BX84_9BACT|nr:MAG: GNAT family N-acetyltransferase [Candidatus Nitronauta litoralis]
MPPSLESAIQVREIKALDEFPGLKDSWEVLGEAHSCSNPYISYSWISTYLETFRRGTPLILVAEKEGRVCALGAFEITESRFMGCSFKSVSFAGSGPTGTGGLSKVAKLFSYDNRLCWSDQMDILWDPECPEGVTAIVEHLKASELWDVLDFREMAPDSNFLKLVKESFGGNSFLLEEFVGTKSGYISMPGSIEEFKKGLSKNLRKNIKLSRNRINKDFGDDTLKVYEDRWEVERLLPRIMELESRSWKGTAGIGAFSNEKNRQFHAKLTERFSEKNRFCLFVLEADEKILSYMYTLIAKKELHFHNTAIHPDYNHYSPGISIILKAVEHCIENGMDRIIVGRGEDYFINALLTGRQDRVWLKVYKNNFHIRLLHDAEFIWAPAIKKLKSRFQKSDVEGAGTN